MSDFDPRDHFVARALESIGSRLNENKFLELLVEVEEILAPDFKLSFPNGDEICRDAGHINIPYYRLPERLLKKAGFCPTPEGVKKIAKFGEVKRLAESADYSALYNPYQGVTLLPTNCQWTALSILSSYSTDYYVEEDFLNVLRAVEAETPFRLYGICHDQIFGEFLHPQSERNVQERIECDLEKLGGYAHTCRSLCTEFPNDSPKRWNWRYQFDGHRDFYQIATFGQYSICGFRVWWD